MPDKPTRQLAAIMFADMVGYTALMQEDEEGARVQRDRHRAVLSAAVHQHNGQILQHYGDGTLSIFSSAVEAVQCAVHIQRSLKAEEVIPLRIGVHTGDIVHDEDGVYGDGVNVASRIEGLAAPGGVTVSGKVFDEIKNHPSISTVALGTVHLKNVGHPTSVFAIANEGLTVPTEEEVRGKNLEAGATAGGGPRRAKKTSDTVPAPVSSAEGESFLARIRDRALVQWSLAYLAGAWAVVEITSFASEQFSWPALVLQSVAILAFAGFILTVVLAWYHGERGRQRVSGPELLMIALLLAIAGGVLTVLGRGEGGRTSSGVVGPVRTTAHRERPVIAVLPFVNMSAEGEESAAFLATGLHDELLTQLSKIASLDVIARTSVMQYARTEKTMPVIGRELGVNTILEGTLMRAGGQVRLNVQLIDAETDTHLWADIYDREFTVANVFQIQSELARRVAGALRAELIPAEAALIAEVPTESLEAYTLFLQGVEATNHLGIEPQDLDAAEAFFARATQEDPEFALAHALLSFMHSYQYLYYDRTEARLTQAAEAASEALRLNPELSEGFLAVAFEAYHRYDNETAWQALSRAEEGLPGSTDLLTLKAEILTRRREWDAALAARERAAVLDPLNPGAAMSLAMGYAEVDRWEDAYAIFDRILEAHPDFYQASFTRGWITWRRTGDGTLGLEALAQVPPEVDVFGLKDFFQWLMAGEVEGKIAALERIPQPVLSFGGFWWAPRELLMGWTYQLTDPARAERGFQEAVQVCLDALEEQPWDPRIHVSLGRAYAGLGMRDEAVRQARRVVEILPMSMDPVFGRDLLEMVSLIYAELGMAEEAADAIEEVFSVPGVKPIYALIGTEFELVRDHPRLRALIREYGEGIPGG